MNFDLGTIIAERQLRVTGQPEIDVRVRMGMPLPLPDDPQGNHYCPYQITGLGGDEVKYAVGADAVQALEMAMRTLATELDVLGRNHRGLMWEDKPFGDYGFFKGVSATREAVATSPVKNSKLILYIVIDSLIFLFVVFFVLNKLVPDLKVFGIAPLGFGVVLGFFVIPLAFFFMFLQKGLKDERTKYKNFYATSNIFMVLWWGGCSAFMVCVTAAMLFGF